MQVCMSLQAAAGEKQIISSVEAFFAATDFARRAELVGQMQSDPAYNRADVRRYLSRANLFEKLEPGRMKTTVSSPDGPNRQVTLRIPDEYSPKTEFPLIYALHGGGGNAAGAIHRVERMLGPDVDRFIVAAPTHYRAADFYPYETPAVLLAIKKLVRVDSDRVYVTGYSAGSYSSWALAVLQPDEFAALVPIAGSLYIGQQTGAFLPNIRHTYVLNVWGAKDSLPGGWDRKATGIADSNRRLRGAVAGLDLPIDFCEIPNKGHGGVRPPKDRLMAALNRLRARYPRQVHHMFQHACQARAYWLERNCLANEHWPSCPVPRDRRPGEHANDAITRALDAQRGELRGYVEGQSITVSCTNAGEITIWVGDGMVDWNRDVRVVAGGTEVFNGRLKPDLFVCLSQAARTYDFHRLRWAGLIVSESSPARPVTGRTVFLEPHP
jgi:hypothetical protein